jgi:hypothetical protein
MSDLKYDFADKKIVVASIEATTSSVGQVTVDNLSLDAGTLSTTTGDLTLQPFAGSDLLTTETLCIANDKTVRWLCPAVSDDEYQIEVSTANNFAWRFSGASDSGTQRHLDIGHYNSGVWNSRFDINTFNGNLLMSGTFSANSAATITDVGVIDVTVHTNNLVSTTVGSKAQSLANGGEGQEMNLICTGLSGNIVVTPGTLLGFTTITFSAIGQGCKLQYSSANGWAVVGINGAVLA